MKLETACPGVDLLNETGSRARVTFTVKTEVYGKTIRRLKHPLNMPGTWSTSGCIRPNGGTFPPPHHFGQAGVKSFFDLPRADVMPGGFDSAPGNNLSLPRLPF